MFEHLDQKKEGLEKETEKKSEILFKKNIEKLTGGIASVLSPVKNVDKEFDRRLKKLEETGRKRGRRFSLIGILGGSIIALVIIYVGFLLLSDTIKISGEANTSSSAVLDMRRGLDVDFIIPAWKKCAVDDDCLETQKNCCSCQEGGDQSAINVAYFAEWNNKISKNCGDVECIALMNCRSGKALCFEGYCVFQRFDIEENIVGEKQNAVDGEVGEEDFLPDNNINEEAPCNPEDENCPNRDFSESSLNEFKESGAYPLELDLKDSDGDGLSDLEEIFYGTDPHNPDTDGDAYSDGDEVRGGYNPLGEGYLNN